MCFYTDFGHANTLEAYQGRYSSSTQGRSQVASSMYSMYTVIIVHGPRRHFENATSGSWASPTGATGRTASLGHVHWAMCPPKSLKLSRQAAGMSKKTFIETKSSGHFSYTTRVVVSILVYEQNNAKFASHVGMLRLFIYCPPLDI